MSYIDTHLHLSAPPEPTHRRVVDFATSFAKRFNTRLAVTSNHRRASESASGRPAAGLPRQIEEVSADVAHDLEAYLETRCFDLNIETRMTVLEDYWGHAPPDGAWQGRLSDICILAAPTGPASLRVAAHWLLHSGKPCLFVPATARTDARMDTILIGWDLSREAARAVQDALPVLQRAANVHAVTFADEKALPSPQANDLLRAYLFARGVEITPATKSAQNLHVGRGILDYALTIGADAIVMGGYGHGRAAEIALGGSTHHVLEHTMIPVLLSH